MVSGVGLVSGAGSILLFVSVETLSSVEWGIFFLADELKALDVVILFFRDLVAAILELLVGFNVKFIVDTDIKNSNLSVGGD
jgi:hypothetical protein